MSPTRKSRKDALLASSHTKLIIGVQLICGGFMEYVE